MQQVAYGITQGIYNHTAPFHPAESYPELPFRETAPVPNPAYALLRDLFFRLGYDAENYGRAEWNPLKELVQPGHTVLLKPNFVLSANYGGGDLFAVVTHPSVLRAMVDYVFIALKGKGRIIIADVPQMDCNWDELMAAQRLDAIQEFYASRFGFKIELYDLREFAVVDRTQLPLSTNRKELKGDPAGSVVVNLGRRSHFYGIPSDNFYGADYNRQETIAHHHGETQEYCVSRTMLSADVFISIPKMKTHKKVGVTLNLKGLVGMNTNKNYLVHYRLGTPAKGGDQLPDAQPGKDRMLVKAQRWAYDKLLARKSALGDAIYNALKRAYVCTLKPLVRVSQETYELDGGNWHGNDSAWRMTADLAKILFFADRDGNLRETPQRRLLCLVDGIIAGEGKGPLSPDAKACGCLVAGANPFAVDLVTARLMGFDPVRLRQFDVTFQPGWNFGLKSKDEIEVRGPQGAVRGAEFFSSSEIPFHFAPHPGWRGQIEAAQACRVAG